MGLKSQADGGHAKLSAESTASEPSTPDETATTPADHSPKIGVFGAIFLILNKMIGTGIFSTPSSVFAASGSVGLSLLLWVLGGIVSAAGLAVYLEYGLAIPKSGGEKNYLDRVYKRPRALASCVFAIHIILLGFSTNNALSFGRYALLASGQENPPDWHARGIGIGCLSFAVCLHATLPQWSLRLNNVLGVFKVVVLAVIVCTGFAALAGRRLGDDPHNFRDAFQFHGGVHDGVAWGVGGASAYATALLRVIFSYTGWENANYIVGELKKPKRTLAVAGPTAVAVVAVLYVLTNVAYFAVIPLEQMATSDVIVAGVFFKAMFGDGAGTRCLPAFIALSNVGNVLAVSYAHSRVNYECAKQGLLPCSSFWASLKPFGTPAAALFLHWLVSIIMLIAPPPGPAYTLLVDLYAYPGAWINIFVAAGLIYLRYRKSEGWTSPFSAWLPVIVVFLLANLFLAIAPFIPPPSGAGNDAGYPYYIFPVVGIVVLLLGGVYWAIWAKVVPKLRGYRLDEQTVVEDDGTESVRYVKVK